MLTSLLLTLLQATTPVSAGAAGAALPEPGVSVTVLIGAETPMTTDTVTKVKPSADITVEGPLAFGDGDIGRTSARLRIFGLPGQAVDVADVNTFDAAQLTLGFAHRVGKLNLGTQSVWTSVAGEWSFATTLSHTPEAVNRYPRRWGVGLRLEERGSGSWLTVLYGRDEAGGDRGWGQWLVSGAVPLSLTKGVIVLGGDATLSVGPANNGLQRDIVRLWVGVSLPDLREVMK